MEEFTTVTAPVRWSPAKVGEYIEGTFEGIQDVEGPHGPYKRYMIRVDDRLYFVYGENVRECVRLLPSRLALKGCIWRLKCIDIDDYTNPGKRACSYTLMAAPRK